MVYPVICEDLPGEGNRVWIEMSNFISDLNCPISSLSLVPAEGLRSGCEDKDLEIDSLCICLRLSS